MEISSHYYGIYALCIACNLKKNVARKIAYASQFVDDAKINTITFDKEYQDSEFDTVAGRSKITNIATCHSYFILKTFNYQAMIFNTSAFHFFPGNKGDSFTRKLRCMQRPKILSDLIEEVISERELIPEKLGMLLHIFADTYAHQGFSGLISKENDVHSVKSYQEKSIAFSIDKLKRKIKGILLFKIDRHIPAYGHAQVYTYPDIPFGKWKYVYDKSDDFSGVDELSENDNNKRYSEAFNTIAHEILMKISDDKVYTEERAYNQEEIKKVIDILNTPTPKGKKIRLWKALLKRYLGDSFVSYSDDEWLRKVFVNYSKKKFDNRVVDGAKLHQDYKDSSWFAYIKAMKWYKKEFITRNSEAGIVIPI
jgi:hypothetical protein